MPASGDLLSGGLERRVKFALAALDADAVVAYVDFAVKSRTAKGVFLEGSSPGAGSYSTGHRRTREKKGLQVQRVDLMMTQRMLDATKGDVTTFADQVKIRYGYIEGLSEAEATKLARYHNTLGAGKSNVVRTYVGLTGDERARAVRILRKQFNRNL
jgi:hypothetical protein